MRLLVLYAHLLLCVFSLHAVIQTDWRLLRGQINATQLRRVHRRVVWLLFGLWATGLMLIAIDTGFDAAAIAARPKLVVKLVCVGMLTLNGVLLRLWCFPRLASKRWLSRPEAMAVMVCGAVSSTSWLMAAFFGIARPLQQLSMRDCLAFYWVALLLAMPAALLLESRLRRGRGPVVQRAGGAAAAAHAGAEDTLPISPRLKSA